MMDEGGLGGCATRQRRAKRHLNVGDEIQDGWCCSAAVWAESRAVSTAQLLIWQREVEGQAEGGWWMVGEVANGRGEGNRLTYAQPVSPSLLQFRSLGGVVGSGRFGAWQSGGWNSMQGQPSPRSQMVRLRRLQQHLSAYCSTWQNRKKGRLRGGGPEIGRGRGRRLCAARCLSLQLCMRVERRGVLRMADAHIDSAHGMLLALSRSCG